MSQNETEFVHLHVHSDMSLLDGAAKIEDLVAKAASFGMPAMALTDHGNLFGAIEFYERAKAAKIQPIIGYEAYVAIGSRHDRRQAGRVNNHHLTLLVENETGWRNLLKLASAAYLEGFYYRPRIDKDLLSRHADGLIGLSGCLSSESSRALRRGDAAGAIRVIEEYREIFGKDDFYLEVLNNSLPEQAQVRAGVVEIHAKTGLPLVMTNDVHYLDREDAQAQEVLLCINTGKTMDSPDRMRMTSDDFYFRSPAEMWDAAKDIPGAAAATLEIASRCRLEIDLKSHHLPQFRPDDGSTPVDYFRRLCDEGLRRRYGAPSDAAKARLELEMKVIESMGFVSYFLIVWDFIRFSRANGIPVGPGRGSAAGSLVAFCLGITEIDPLRYDLLFERFLNSERISLPDIDIDFCKEKRDRVIKYVQEKYGADHVSQIITFGTMAAKAALRDVGRALNVPLQEVDYIAKKIPVGPKVHLEESIKQDLELQRFHDENPLYKRLFDVALRLEGLSRHASTHAAGVVIADKPLVEYVPLFKNGDDVVTQFSMTSLESIGLLKMDFLGLNTLTLLDHAVALVKRHHGTDLDLNALGLDDPATYALLCRGETTGVFQLESAGMTDLVQRLKPDCFEDVIALLALYRPGPLESGMVDMYVRRKHGEERVAFEHPLLQPILAETKGVILYQEQVMRIANRLAGFSLNEADSLRKAMGKKKPEILAKFREKFVVGCGKNGVSEAIATKLWEDIEKFAGYGFNKSHSTAYALISFQTAWLKAHYPVEFVCALLSSEIGNTDKIVDYVDLARRMGIEILPPDANRSEARFTVEGKSVRFGLGAIKNVGFRAIESIVAAREKDGPFADLFAFCERIDVHLNNKATIESFVEAGVFDSWGRTRASLFAAVPDALETGSSAQSDRRAGQLGLFGAKGVAPAPKVRLSDVPEWPEKEKLAREKEMLGIYLTGHPLRPWAEVLRRFSSTTSRKAGALPPKAEVTVGGLVKSVRILVAKAGRSAGESFAAIVLEDLDGTLPAIVFSKEFKQFGARIAADSVVFLRGTVDVRRDAPQLVVSEIIPIEDAERLLTKSVRVALDSATVPAEKLVDLRRALEAHPGEVPVVLEVTTREGAKAVVRTGGAFRVQPGSRLRETIERILGSGSVTFQAA